MVRVFYDRVSPIANVSNDPCQSFHLGYIIAYVADDLATDGDAETTFCPRI
jgi:hypothetical protein